MLKRTISIILSALMLLMLCACKDKPESVTEGDRVIGSGGVVDNVFDDDREETQDTPTDGEEDPSVSQDPTEQTQPEDDPESSTEDPTEATEPEQTDPPASGDKPDGEMTYEKFNSLSSKEKREYQESFGDIALFFEWYEQAKLKYEEENPPIIVGGDGTIVLP